MALATKFRVQGTSDVFGQITVNIQLNNYLGSIIDLDGAGRDWIRLKIGDNSSEMSSPILAGKLTFSFYVTDDFQTTEIGKSEVYTYYVEVLDENLDQIWAGWAMPEEYTEAYHNTPYVATVVASDGLQELKNVNYPLQDGKATLFTHLQTCLISTFVNNNIFESVNIYSNGMNSTASDSPFKQAQVTYNSFRSISETPKAYEVLSSLLVPFFARIYQYRGWRIENILEKRSSYVVREYDITGTFVSQSTFNPLVKFDTDYGTFKAFIQKSGQLSIRPALNNAEVYFNTVEPVEPTTTGGFQDADDWVSTTELDKWTVVAGGGANQISIEQVPSSFDGNEFAVKIPGRKTSLELTDYIESDAVNIATADYESINVDFAHYANYPAIVLLGSKPILYFEIVFTETSSGDVYNWSGSEWVLIPLGQTRRRLRIDFNDRMKWRRYSAVIDRVPSTGTIKFRFYKLIKSGTEGVTELRLTAWKTNLIVSQPTNAALLLEAGTTNVFTQYKGPSFPHIISDGTVLNAAGVMDVANTLTATWARRGVTESLNIRRLFLTQWLSFNSRPTEILSGVIHQKGEVITPMSVVKDKDAVSSTRYVMQSYEMSLGTGIGSASYREIVMEDANINAFQEFLDSIRLGDFFATTVNYNIFIGGAPGLSPGANPGQIDLNFNLQGDVRGGLNQAEITPAAIQNKARLDLTGLTADDIVLGAVKDSPDQENMTNLRLSDIKPLVSTPVTIGSPANGLSISGTQVLTIGLASTSNNGALSSTDWNTFNNKLNLTSPITGYTVGANTALADTDTILQAFGKVQGQINARISGTIASGQVAFGTGANTVGGDSGFTYTSGSKFLLLTGTDARFQIRAITPTIAGGQGQLTIRSTDAVAVDKGGIISFNADTTSLAGYPVAHIAGKLEAVGTGVYSGYLQFLTTASNGAVTERARITSTGLVGIATTSPSNTLDVNGTARIRTISNLGSAATSVLVPSATGVLSLRALAELATDMGTSFDGRYVSKLVNDDKLGNLRFLNASSLPIVRITPNGSEFANVFETVQIDGTVTMAFNRQGQIIQNASSTGSGSTPVSLSQGGTQYARARNSLPESGETNLISFEFSNRAVFIRSANSLQRSQSTNGFTRRDELYLNYSQTVATAGTINNLAINADCKLLILTGATDLTGVVPVNNTRLLRIEARSASRIIRHESASSTAANRFSIGADLTINAGEVYQFIYTDSRWRFINDTRDQFAVKTTATADQTLPSGVLTILDYDSTLINNSTNTYTVGTDGRITINITGIYTITAGVVIEADAVTALESAFLGIFRNGDLVAISSINTTIAAGAQSGLSTSTILSLTATDIIDCRALVNSVGGVANGLARRLGTLLGANATQVNSLSITKNSM